MKKLFWCLFLSIILVLTTQVVNAQDDNVIERLHIDIWPEYDRSEVLVIYRISLASVMDLPAEFSIRIPKTVGKPNTVAMKDIDGLLYPLNYSIDNEGQWLRISFITPSSDLQIEFYDPYFSCGDHTRCYNFEWPGDYSISALTISVQQPLNSKNMQIVPNMGTGQLRPDKLRYYTLVASTVNTEEEFSVNLSYEKTDNTLSASMQPVEPVEPIDQDTAGRISFQEMLPWAFGIVGLIMIIGVGFWVWSSGWNLKPKNRHIINNTESNYIDTRNIKEERYCNHCGKRAADGDIYCRTCGEKIVAD